MGCAVCAYPRRAGGGVSGITVTASPVFDAHVRTLAEGEETPPQVRAAFTPEQEAEVRRIVREEIAACAAAERRASYDRAERLWGLPEGYFTRVEAKLQAADQGSSSGSPQPC